MSVRGSEEFVGRTWARFLCEPASETERGLFDRLSESAQQSLGMGRREEVRLPLQTSRLEGSQ